MTDSDPSDSPSQVSLEMLDGGVALITLGGKDRGNPWNFEMASEYVSVLGTLERDRDVRAVVVTGAGTSFSVGAGIDVLTQILESGGYPEGAPGPECHIRPLSFRKPLISAICGACIGVGLLIALTSDVRFGAPDSKISTAFSRRGLPAEYGMSWILPRLIGVPASLDLLISGRIVSGVEAGSMGLLNFVVPVDQVLERAVDYARDIATACSPSSVATIKAQVWGDIEVPLHEAFWRTQALVESSFTSADLAEGVASFEEKRPPRFGALEPPEAG
jgi:enoyl-CoA hydratase/carnithine racemase